MNWGVGDYLTTSQTKVDTGQDIGKSEDSKAALDSKVLLSVVVRNSMYVMHACIAWC